MPPVDLKTVGSPSLRYSLSDLPPDIRTLLLGLVGVNLTYLIGHWGDLDFGSFLTPLLASVVPGLLSFALSYVTNTQKTIAVDASTKP